MSKTYYFARVLDGSAAEIISSDKNSIADRYEPWFVAQCVPCKSDTKPGDIYDSGEGTFVSPVQPEPTPEEVAAAEASAALTKASGILTARMQRQLVQADAFTATEFSLFARAGLFPLWEAGAEYAAGNRIVHDGIVYEVQQPVTALEHQAPGSEGMLAVYRPLSADPETGDEPDGSLENPHPFINGMNVYANSYYSFEGAVYLAKGDMLPCLWNPGTEGLWQWERVG